MTRTFPLGRLALLGIALSMMWAATAQAAVQVAAGVEISSLRMTGTDDARKGYASNPAVDAAGGSQVFFEWYPFQRLGIGYRYIWVEEEQRHCTIFGCLPYNQTFTLEANLPTVQLIVVSAPVYRIALLLGRGDVDYRYSAYDGGAPTPYFTATSSGDATLYGLFADISAGRNPKFPWYRHWGIRFAYYRLTTRIKPVNGLFLDATGNLFSVGFRYEFGN